MCWWYRSGALVALFLSVWLSLGAAKRGVCSLRKYAIHAAPPEPPKVAPEICRPKDLAVSISRVYADVNANSPTEYWDYEALHLDWGSSERYSIGKELGSGKYSTVYLGRDLETRKRVVVKVLEPIEKMRVKREINCLQNLHGGPNIIQLIDLVRNKQNMNMWLVFEHVNSTDFPKLNKNISDYDIRYYTYELLKALEYAHSMGIMHRDIKPHNVMIDHPKRKLRLIDWGLAEHYHPAKTYNSRVASLYYKGPELLVALPTYDYSLDMWGVGVLFASLLFKKVPFFPGEDRDDMLVKIVQVLGSDGLLEYLKTYNIVLRKRYLKLLLGYRKKEWSEFIRPSNKHIAHPEAIELLSGLLRYDHQTRLTAKEAMALPYFAPIRKAEAKAKKAKKAKKMMKK